MINNFGFFQDNESIISKKSHNIEAKKEKQETRESTLVTIPEDDTEPKENVDEEDIFQSITKNSDESNTNIEFKQNEDDFIVDTKDLSVLTEETETESELTNETENQEEKSTSKSKVKFEDFSFSGFIDEKQKLSESDEDTTKDADNLVEDINNGKGEILSSATVSGYKTKDETDDLSKDDELGIQVESNVKFEDFGFTGFIEEKTDKDEIPKDSDLETNTQLDLDEDNDECLKIESNVKFEDFSFTGFIEEKSDPNENTKESETKSQSDIVEEDESNLKVESKFKFEDFSFTGFIEEKSENSESLEKDSDSQNETPDDNQDQAEKPTFAVESQVKFEDFGFTGFIEPKPDENDGSKNEKEVSADHQTSEDNIKDEDLSSEVVDNAESSTEDVTFFDF